jgi:catechol 2,3-dioxygenase-like lactoylglutathione lyase family enzyme
VSTTVVNHVGQVVTDLDRARAFYEEVLGFAFWFESTVPDEAAAKLLSLPAPLGVRLVYLTLGDFTLELIHYGAEGAAADCVRRGMDQTGLTHLSMSVDAISDVAARAQAFGAEVIEASNLGVALMVRDPDGQLVELLDPSFRQHLPPRP